MPLTLIRSAQVACAVVASFVESVALAQTDSPFVEGVYSMCEEVAGYSGETIELKGGKFRYWFYSDLSVAGKKEPKYPLSGNYKLRGDEIYLDHPEIYSRERTFEVINGVPVLLRDESLKYWRDCGRVGEYGVLIRVGDEIMGKKEPARPSTYVLYTEDMRKRERWEFETRFMDQPDPVRDVLRAWTAGGDPHLENRKGWIKEIRANLDPKLIQQLVGLMGYDRSLSGTAFSILEEIYVGEPQILKLKGFDRKSPAFVPAMEALIDGFANAQESVALRDCIRVFQQATGTKTAKIDIPAAGVMIRLTVNQNSGYRDGSGDLKNSSVAPKTYKWVEEMPIIIPVCQEWARQKLLAMKDGG